MDSIKFNTDKKIEPLRLALKDRKSELRKLGLERLLSAVYKRDLIITQLMEELSVDINVIESLKLSNLNLVVDQMIALVKERVCRAPSGLRRYEIVERYYGLDGNMSARLSAMAAKHSISRERVRQLKERCLESLRSPDSLSFLESALITVAHQSFRRGRFAEGMEENKIRDFPNRLIDICEHRNFAMLQNASEKLTEQQKNAYYALKKSNRVKISGCPGSGKTLIAVLHAFDLARQGKNVLFTCYNRAMATYLESVFDNQANLTVASFHALCLRLGTRAGIRIPGGWNASVWDKKFPKVLLSALKKMPELKFDAVIIDDAQDLKSNWWQALIACLKDEGKGGLFYFVDDNCLLKEEKSIQPEVQTSVHVNENVRTPGRAIPFIMPGYISENEMKSCTLRGELPEFFLCNTRDDVRMTISHLVERVTSSGNIMPSQIAVLTPRLTKQSDAYACSIKNCGRLVVRYSQRSSHAILSRIVTFKGLERSCIILVDLDEQFQALEAEEKLKLLYIAASRCTDKLILIGNHAGLRTVNSICQIRQKIERYQQSNQMYPNMVPDQSDVLRMS